MSVPVLRARIVPNGTLLRARVLPRIPPLPLELRFVNGVVQWRVGNDDWTDLFAIEDITGDTVIVTGSGAVNVGDDDGHIILNKAAPSATTINLPPVADRNGLALHVVDFAGNGGDITLTPDGSETIMGLSSATLVSNGQGLGLAASITLYPNEDLGGWYA